MLTVLLLLDIDLANSGVLPGGVAIAVVGWAGLVVGRGRAARRRGRLDAGARLARTRCGVCPHRFAPTSAARSSSSATAVFVGVVTWMLVPLIVPALGCAALAVVAIPERRRAR